MIDDPMQRARRLLADAPSWQELKRQLDTDGIVNRIGAAGVERLLAEWHGNEVAGLDDVALTQELGFWADGGSYDRHLKGYNALPPAVLIDEASRRGWFVRSLGSGGTVVNAPEGKPLVVRR